MLMTTTTSLTCTWNAVHSNLISFLATTPTSEVIRTHLKYHTGNTQSNDYFLFFTFFGVKRWDRTVCDLSFSPHLVVEGDGSRAVQVLPDKNFPHGAIQVGNFNAVGSRVGPVDLPADRVHCQAISRHQAWREEDCGEMKWERCDRAEDSYSITCASRPSSPVDMMSSCASPFMLALLILFNVLSDQ